MRLLPTRVLLGAAAVALAMAVGGCAPQSTPAPTVALTASPEPSAAMPTASPAPAHTIAFAGDCANVLGADGPAAVLGAGATPDDLDGWVDPSFGTLGGIDCRWAIDGTATADNPTYLQVQAYPLESVPTPLREEITSTQCAATYDSPVCRLGRAAGDVWLLASTAGFSEKSPTDAEQSLLERALELSQSRLPAFPVPHRAVATDAWWNLTTDCNGLGQRMHLDELLGEGYQTGWWEGDPDKQWDNRLTASQGVERMCQWFPDYSREDANGGKYGMPTLSTFPGAAWDASLFTTGEPIQVAGAQNARVLKHNIVATDGVNVVSLSRVDDIAAAQEVLARFFRAQQAG